MKTPILLFNLCLLLEANIPAAEPTRLQLNSVLSETRQNIYVTFWNGSYKTNGINDPIVFLIDKPIKYGFGSTQPKPYNVLALGEKYGCNISSAVP